MALEIDFVESVQLGTSTGDPFDTVSVQVKVGAGYGFPVNSFDVFSLNFDPNAATFFALNAAPGLFTNVNSTPGALDFSGFVSGPDVAPGSLLATIVFHLTSGATSVGLTGITGDLNSDPTSSHADVPCFAAGTLIRTRRGDVPVETLREGDEVMTVLGGGWSRLVWLGERRVNCARHPRPHDIMPVRVARDAFAPGVPARDLLLSPDHSVYADGVLMPVRYLLNGATVIQQNVARISYFHVELERHDVLLAEGLPAETYLDTGNRTAFANGGEGIMAHADFALRTWQTKACAALVCSGPELAAVRAALLARVGELGHAITAAADPVLLVDGRMLTPEVSGTTLHFRLPDGARDIRLVSRAAVPAHREVASDDHRRLGIAVAGVTADGRAVSLDDSRLAAGWHQPEPGWRWTDGEAVLKLEGASELKVDVAITLTYWVAEPVRKAQAA